MGSLRSRDLVFVLGGFLFLGLLNAQVGIDIGDADLIDSLKIPFFTAVAYLTGYLLQELGSLFLYRTALAADHTKIDAWFCRQLVPNYLEGRYKKLTDQEETDYFRIGHTDTVVERTQFLRGVCYVSGTGLLAIAALDFLFPYFGRGGSGNVAIQLLELVSGMFLIMRGRIEAMQTQRSIRKALKVAKEKAATMQAAE